MIMDMNRGDSDARYGFLSVVEIDRLGYCGGLLVLSTRGRPLEFHCTAPVNPNRAQQILYGRSLRPFVVCDRIGVTLIQKVSESLNMILVDDAELSGLADLIQVPLVRVYRDGQMPDWPSGHRLELEGQDISISAAASDDCESMLRLFLRNLPLTEPFDRIHQAIGEAHAKAA
jgi:hypothetical protein